MGKCGTLRCKGTTGIICKNIEAREWVEYCPVCRTETPVEAPRRPDAADRLASGAKADFEKAAYGQAEEGFLAAAQKTGDRARKEFYLWCSLLARYGVFYVDDDLHAKSYIPLFMRHPLPDFYLKRTEAYRGIGPADQKLADDLHMLLRKIDTQSDASFRVFVAWHGEECKPIAGEAANAISTSGYSAFCSVTTLDEKTADEYEPLIYTGLHQADVMAIVVDDLNALNAKFLSKEIERFHNRKKADDRLVTLLFALPGYTGHNTALPNSHVITLKGQTEKDCAKEIKEAVIGNLRDIRLQTIQQSQPRPATRPKPLRRVLALLAAVCLLIGGGVLFKWWSDRSQPPQPSGEQGGVGVFAVETERADITEEPAATPTAEPTAEPTPEPTATPTAEPTATPTVEPTPKPTAEPTKAPTPTPTLSMAEQIALADAQHDSYVLAEALLAEGKYQEASDAFAAAGDYSDAASRVNEPYYVQAEDLMSAKNYDQASALFAILAEKGDSDAADRVNEPYYVQAEDLLAAGDYDGALIRFQVLANNGYGDAADRVKKLPEQKKEYENGMACLQKGSYFDALKSFRAAGNYSDAVEKTRRLYGSFADCFAAGVFYTVALRMDGTVVAVGDNDNTQCEVSGWRDIVAASGDTNHTVGLKADGTVVAVGDNGLSQCEVSGWSDIVAVSAGGWYTVGLKADGTVVAVGSNYYGQCEVSGWSDIVAVIAGGYHTVGLKADGTVVAVGEKKYDRCNVSGWRDIVAVSAGYRHTVGLKADGTVVAVGWNDYGQCNVFGWCDIVAVSAGNFHTVGLKADGTVVAVGNNDYGQCEVSGWSDIVAVSAGKWHTVGLKADGTVVAVGSNEYGQCKVSDWTNIGPNKAYLQTLFANTPQ